MGVGGGGCSARVGECVCVFMRVSVRVGVCVGGGWSGG